MSEALLIFRGEVAASAAGELIVDAIDSRAGSTKLAISGALADAALRVARLAGKHVRQNELIAALDRELQLDRDIASSLIAQLVSAQVLSAEVKATTRLIFSGHSEIADALRSELSSALWPIALEGVEIAVLGTLGSSAWYREVERLRMRNVRVLTCSFDGAGCWIGPLFEPIHEASEHAVESQARGPCPLCLHARRVAAGAADNTDVTVSYPPSLSLVAELIQRVAELCARGELSASRVFYSEGTTSEWHTLLAQPHCALCDQLEKQSFRNLGTQAESYARMLEAELTHDSNDEPSEAQRRAFLDPRLGPLSLEVHDAPETFRELPLVLGSFRTAHRSQNGFVARDFASVMFGTGATERRRLLVAYAEGIERYAGVTDQPDITAVPFRELTPHALAPELTVRFAEQQYASGVSVRHTNQALDWSWVYDWTSAECRLMLHDAVSYGRDLRAGGAKLFDDPFSSGMSAHRSMTLALERSLFELIERDAFMLAWYLRLPLRELDLSRIEDAELHDLHDYLEKAGVRVQFRDLRVDFSLPCVLAVAEAQRDFGPWKAGGKILSACAGASFADAARHALRELLGHYTAFALVSPEGDKSMDPQTGELRPWWPAFAALLEPRADEPLGFFGNDPALRVEDARLSDVALRAEFMRRDLAVYIRKLGRRDIAQSGLVALRAIVPGLIRLTPTQASVNFGEPRFDQIRQRWNAREGLNPMPHPLA